MHSIVIVKFFGPKAVSASSLRAHLHAILGVIFLYCSDACFIVLYYSCILTLQGGSPYLKVIEVRLKVIEAKLPSKI